jgi:hypothetical protein
MTYVLAAMAASGVFVVAGWRSKHARGVAAARNWEGLPIDPLWGQEEAHFDVSDVPADAGAAIRLVLKRLAPVMASQSVQAEIAAASGLLVRMKGAALAELLEELLTAAIHNAPASRLLMTATKRVDRIYISITDDMPGADPAVRLGSIRGLMERVALRGGTLDVNVRPAEGTTMTLRLAALSENDAPVLEPAAGAAVRADGLALRAER